MSGSCHTACPNTIVGRITALYTCLALRNVAPQVEAVVRVRARVCFAIFSLILLTCLPHFKEGSRCTPRTRTSVFGCTVVRPNVIYFAILNRFGVLVRWISSYLLGSKVAQCLNAHLRHLSCILLSVRHVCDVDSPQAKMLTSSTNPTALALRPD